MEEETVKEKNVSGYMEEFIIILFFLVILAYWLQCSVLGKWYCLCSGAALALFSYLLYPLTIQQSGNLLSDMPLNAGLVQNITAVQLVEILIFMLLQLQVVLPALYGCRRSAGFVRGIQDIMLYFPGPMIFAAVACFQFMAFQFNFKMEFNHTALIFALLILLSAIVMPVLLRLLLPLTEARLELKFFIHVFQLAPVLLMIAYVQQKAYTGAIQKLPLMPFLCLTLLFLCGSAAGYIINQRTLKRNRNNGIF